VGVPTEKSVPTASYKKRSVPTAAAAAFAYYIYYLLSLYYILYRAAKNVFVGT
jgi:hypothetical protein